MHKLDVLLPVFNCEKYIEESIQSIRNQTYKDFRVIIIDDGSKDNTSIIIKKICEIDSRIVYIRQENNGIVKALNHGLSFCNAPYVARMDGDDISHPTRFEKELGYLEAHPECVAVGCQIRHIDENGKLICEYPEYIDPSVCSATAFPAVEPYIIHPMLMVRRDALERIGGYRPVYNCEDADLYWRLKDVGRLFSFHEALGDYRIHLESVSSTSIINGRQQAVWSQLAALSEQRRQDGKKDLGFSTLFSENVRSKETLSDIITAASTDLSCAEKKWLEEASCAKFLGLCYYRPFEPEHSDIEFIRIIERRCHSAEHQKPYALFFQASRAASGRLLLSGHIREAFRLSAPRYWPSIILRAAAKHILPKSTQHAIVRLVKKIREK